MTPNTRGFFLFLLILIIVGIASLENKSFMHRFNWFRRIHQFIKIIFWVMLIVYTSAFSYWLFTYLLFPTDH